MFHPRPCGCKGQRSCLLCEKDHGAWKTESWVTEEDKEWSYIYCPLCDFAWPGWETNSWRIHPNHQGEPIKLCGIKLLLEFVSEEEEKDLLVYMDEIPWDLSQSGRRKQNYGPKCNFKKRRLRTETFGGYPAFTKFIQDRFTTVDILKGFQTVEQCSLEYIVERGASIDPHIDDCWIWGERIPTLSLLADSTLTLRKFNGPRSKYNLTDTEGYPPIIRENGTVRVDEEIAREFNQLSQKRSGYENSQEKPQEYIGSKKSIISSLQRIPGRCLVRIPMPRRSLLILYGSARYDWEHGILREDIPSRRICITYRELTPTFLSHGSESETGSQLLETSKCFWDHRQHYGLNT
ncbi:alpha-ketoglutarate-dependent dioxygenase alkB homolog 4 [Panulirus ornatus]|uniref:alpha-ketoglutarate-dependent dioxygenase alkB homolog 4 n=1 Tax=Panulirus ornatus TaxID=150431 RepID=UPI003A846533